MEIASLEIPLFIKDLLEALVFEKGNLIEREEIIGETFSVWGREMVARLCGNLSGTAVNQIRVQYNSGGSSYWSTLAVASKSRANNTLTIESGTFTTPGTYVLVEQSNSGAGANYHNSISCSVVLGSDSELVFRIRTVFTGLPGAGNNVPAARLGNIGDYYDHPVSTITYDGVSGTYNLASSNAILSNTILEVTHTSQPTIPETFTYLNVYIAGGYLFDQLTGNSIVVASGQEIYAKFRYTF